MTKCQRPTLNFHLQYSFNFGYRLFIFVKQFDSGGGSEIRRESDK